jgi:hypothetical protein
VSGEVQKLSGEVQNYLRGGAHLKMRLWKAELQCTELCQCDNMESTELIVTMIHETKGMECCARVSCCSWGESSTQREAIKEAMLPRLF